MTDVSNRLIDDVACAVLCGGRSRRMGFDKAGALLQGRELIDHVLEKVTGLFTRVMLSGRDPSTCAREGFPVVIDQHDVPTPLAGIHASLKALGRGRLMVVAVDMPFVSPQVLRLLAGYAPKADVVVPRIHGYLEPLLAVYSTRCIQAIENRFAAGDAKVTGFYDDVEVVQVDQASIARVDRTLRSFFNINSPDALEQAERYLRSETHQAE